MYGSRWHIGQSFSLCTGTNHPLTIYLKHLRADADQIQLGRLIEQLNKLIHSADGEKKTDVEKRGKLQKQIRAMVYLSDYCQSSRAL